MRECSESAVGEGIGKAEGNCDPAFDWRKPVADCAATADGEPADCVSWGDARVGRGVLVARRHRAVCPGAPAATAGVECQSGPARLGIFARVDGFDGNCVWIGAGTACYTAGLEHSD